MHRGLIFFLFLLIFSNAVVSQELKLSVPPKPHFNSEQEKDAFETLKKADFESEFLLLHALGSSASETLAQKHLTMVKAFVQELRPKVEKTGKAEKKIKLIYKEVHKAFLKKYVLKNYFQDIFSRGEYNCVSATALYALILQELNIPFSVKETPVHVFLVAYPQSYRIAVESTDPQTGYFVFDSKFKNQYISELRKMKLISEEEYGSKSVEALFDEMYFENKEINLPELIALQYYNDGLYQMEEESYDKSLQQFEKAYLLYPSERIGFFIYNTSLLALEKLSYSDPEYMDYVAKLASLQGIDKLQELIKGEFALFTQDQLLNKPNPVFYDKMYTRLTSGINDSSLVKEISQIYYYEKARTAFNSGKSSEALTNIEKAVQLFPQHPDNNTLLAACLSQNLNTIYSFDEKTMLLESYFNKYPGLKENNLMYSQLLHFYLVQFAQAYELQQEKKGKQYQETFEKAYQLKRDGKEGYVLDPNLIGRAYSVAAVFFFKKGQTNTAKQIIDKGLDYAPDNVELLQRKRLIH